MKTRESGMPNEEQWESFFQPEEVLDRLALRQVAGPVVEFGCGFGTFTIPAAHRASGMLHAFDIDPQMIVRVQAKADLAGLSNVVCELRDFVAAGTGLPDDYADYAMVFNLLHAERPGDLLAEAWRVLRPGGMLAIMHWNYDPSTPRGPSMAIRPRPQQCRDWAVAAGFRLRPPGIVELPPYHYGMVLEKAVRS